MARYYTNAWGLQQTDHAEELAVIRAKADKASGMDKVFIQLAADLLQSHDETGISLDDWPTARRFVEHFTGSPVLPNCI
jgi:hypothetical protein